MPPFSFRLKLLLAMMLVVIGVTGSVLYVVRQRVAASYRAISEREFKSRVQSFGQLQEARLSHIKRRFEDFSRSSRLRHAIGRVNEAHAANDLQDFTAAAELMYKVTTDELRDYLGQSGGHRRPLFFRLLDSEGRPVRLPAGSEAGITQPRAQEGLREKILRLKKALANEASQQVGYLAPEIDEGRVELAEVILTIITDTDSTPAGALIVGFPLLTRAPVDRGATRAMKSDDSIQSGVWLENDLYSDEIPEEIHHSLDPLLRAIPADKEEGNFEATLAGLPYRIYFRALNPRSAFPMAYQISLYSLDELRRTQADLRGKIVGFGVLALIGAFAVSLLLSHGLSVPIRELVAGTKQVEAGNYTAKVRVRSRDEIGQLAESFNEMTDGLALKEKYRSVLDKVTDKDVAKQLLHGKISLGGEARQASMLFCDIRGFTALTEQMPPEEVIHMLNEHFTPLTRVVKEHNGVVDKFVGDLIMAVFGAPKSYGHDAYDAARCALDMIGERKKLNEHSKYKIEVGIGVATGDVLAGCMGSDDRLNYTVLGERVNLASRLCGQAARGEVVIDSTTHQLLGDLATVESMPPLKLKGVSYPVPAYKLREIKPLPAKS